MKKYLLSLGALALLASCSSEPSDFRPGKKVSTDAVYAGGRPTGLYPSNNEPNASHRAAAHGEGHASHGEGHSEGHATHAEAPTEGHAEGHTEGVMPATEAKATGPQPASESQEPPKTAADAEDAAE